MRFEPYIVDIKHRLRVGLIVECAREEIQRVNLAPAGNRTRALHRLKREGELLPTGEIHRKLIIEEIQRVVVYLVGRIIEHSVRVRRRTDCDMLARCHLGINPHRNRVVAAPIGRDIRGHNRRVEVVILPKSRIASAPDILGRILHPAQLRLIARADIISAV